MKKDRTYLLVDSHNLYFRTRYVVRANTAEEKRGLLFHIFFNSLLSTCEKFNCSNIVLFFDNGSWRKEYYPNYKLNRKQKELLKSPSEKEEDQIFFEGYKILQEFFMEKTNLPCLKAENLETDDLISEFVFLYHDTNHVIFSSDKDFVQLLNENIILYDGMNEKIYKTENSFIDKISIDTKNIKEINIVKEPQWELFKKIMRGDPSDNVFPVLPGARETRLRKVFLDMERKGYVWNSFMLQETITRDGKKRLVNEIYEINKKIIDLSAKPNEIRKKSIHHILSSINNKKKIVGVGINFIKFCEKHGLENLKRSPEKVSKMLNCNFNNEMLVSKMKE